MNSGRKGGRETSQEVITIIPARDDGALDQGGRGGQ